MGYKNYSSDELDKILNSPREITKDPYKLLTSYLFNSIVDMFIRDEEGNAKVIWGRLINTKRLMRYVEECILDFKSADENETTIRISGQAYSIKNGSKIDYHRAKDIIGFMTSGEYSIISKEGIFNVQEEGEDTYESRKQRFADDRLYYWKVMATGQTDEGYDKLTDIEVAIYCWAMWIKTVPMSKIVNDETIQEWWKREYEYFEVPLKDIKTCFDTSLVENNKMNTPTLFSAKKVREWNKSHKQKSVIDTMTDEEAQKEWFINLGVNMMRI